MPRTLRTLPSLWREQKNRELVNELRRHPERLPGHVQLFIPTQCRDKHNRSSVLTNNNSKQQLNRTTNTPGFSAATHVWPQLPNKLDIVVDPNVMKKFDDELKTIKDNFNQELKRSNEIYEKKMIQFREGWQLISQQVKIQQEMITGLSASIISTVMPMGASVLQIMSSIIQILQNNEQNETLKNNLNQMSQQLLIENNKFLEYHTSIQKHQKQLTTLIGKLTAASIDGMDLLFCSNE
ncbi:unnamed protein product [Didymodactylos carnosus]|uniref:Uncharacterized protein n=1 Tax=Didymodactylos carnosus TaxID=1234261 RepID=A0A8S2TVD5_9BILA|nr:unnamed protein product [Didymodactylos carnosus]CAF3859982.1 unnamed protein product [Didymodactylos carnosus]CAF4309581.1 unnamed protein product [Didymodactylos carnosus]